MLKEIPVKNDRALLKIPGNKQETIEFAVDQWVQSAKDAILDHNAFYVALSGGSTPKAIFQKLAKEHKNSFDWTKVHLFWSDERAVPPTDKESNYKMAMDAGLKTLGIPDSQIHRMEAETNIESNAKKYEELIKSILGSTPFDLIMLGMGDDGHTASLFPNSPALKERENLVVANYVESKKTHRMTMTFPCLNLSHNTVLYVIGEAKKDMLYKVLMEDQTLPSNKVGTRHKKAIWIADEQAAQKVMGTQ